MSGGITLAVVSQFQRRDQAAVEACFKEFANPGELLPGMLRLASRTIMFRLFARLTEFFYRARGQLVQLDLTRYERILSQINERDFEAESDERLKERSTDLAARARQGSPLDKLLVEAFALARVCPCVLAMRPFDVQVLAAIAMHQGKLAEMQTGEGKTLAAVLPAYLNALTGQGVHVLTFNDYLARRDAQWMGPLLPFPGPYRRDRSTGNEPSGAQKGVHVRRNLRHRQRSGF